MARRPNTATAEALDDVFDNYMVDSDEDPFRDLDTTLEGPKDTTNNTKKRKTTSDDENDRLGVDEKVKVIKKRMPVPKLDEARLLSQAGLPKLKASFRSKLAPKLKGKGHEFSDAAKLLQFYQLWLDALYPRAKFADGLAMIEKVGHSKRMQVMRKAWIDEGKRKTGDYMDDDDYRPSQPRAADAATGSTTNPEGPAAGKATGDSIFGNRQTEDDSFFIPEMNSRSENEPDGPPEDELDAILAEQESTQPNISKPSVRQPANDDSEGEDDLDALLAEEDARRKKSQQPSSRSTVLDDEDDVDALLAEHDARRKETAPITPPTVTKKAATPPAEEEDELDDLDALLAEHDAAQSQDNTTVQPEPATHTAAPSPEPQPSSIPSHNPDLDLNDLPASQDLPPHPPVHSAATLPTTSKQEESTDTNPNPSHPPLTSIHVPVPDDEDATGLLPSSSPVKDPENVELDERDLEGF
ncbi:putative replication fork protection component [Phaeomoniella chlamydospora]|uniref:Chromosome segregation in meiosis protein n=1 Tax=Phaeomoniella chlamydospora TaxID=158046 RepID=A0A0G2G0U1_PHACM|nr:putative replication fork protection component [Phaeomoniella chlamydospora]